MRYIYINNLFKLHFLKSIIKYNFFYNISNCILLNKDNKIINKKNS